MHRFALALLLGGVALLVSWANAPASPAPDAADAASAPSLDQLAPVVADVNAQVDRLRERLSAPPTRPDPRRDPFRFGRRTEAPRPVNPAAAAPLAEGLAEPLPPPLPRLIAIMESPADGGILRTAVLSEGEGLAIVKPGDTVGRFIVRSIGVDLLDLIDVATARAFSVSLK